MQQKVEASLLNLQLFNCPNSFREAQFKNNQQTLTKLTDF